MKRIRLGSGPCGVGDVRNKMGRMGQHLVLRLFFFFDNTSGVALVASDVTRVERKRKEVFFKKKLLRSSALQNQFFLTPLAIESRALLLLSDFNSGFTDMALGQTG